MDFPKVSGEGSDYVWGLGEEPEARVRVVEGTLPASPRSEEEGSEPSSPLIRWWAEHPQDEPWEAHYEDSDYESDCGDERDPELWATFRESLTDPDKFVASFVCIFITTSWMGAWDAVLRARVGKETYFLKSYGLLYLKEAEPEALDRLADWLHVLSVPLVEYWEKRLQVDAEAGMAFPRMPKFPFKNNACRTYRGAEYFRRMLMKMMSDLSQWVPPAELTKEARACLLQCLQEIRVFLEQDSRSHSEIVPLCDRINKEVKKIETERFNEVSQEMVPCVIL